MTMSEPIIHDPGNERIDRVYVFLSIDDEGRNGIVAEVLHGLGSTPLVTASPKTAEVMKTLAQDVAKRTGKTVGMFAFRRETQLWQSD
jgi:hypothetical protein